MPNQSQTLSQSPENATKNNADRKPAVRTMKSDIEELFQTTKPSLVQILSKETKTAPLPRGALIAQARRRTILLVVATLLFVIGAALLYMGEREEKPMPKLVAPKPFFATETARTISVKTSERSLFLRLIEDSIREREREGTIKRIIIKLQDGSVERFAELRDIFEFYRIKPPHGFLSQIAQPLMPFIYYGGDGNRVGFIAKTTDPERTLAQFLNWEPSLLRDLQPFFFEESPQIIIAPFEDRTYRNIDWRFLKLSQTEDLGIAHTIFPARNLVVLTMGKEPMQTVINRLYENR